MKRIRLFARMADPSASPAPTVTSATPSDGTTAVGDTSGTHAGVMTITGTGFAAGATVLVGGVAATGVTFVSATTITCKPPTLASGLHAIRVTNPDAQFGELAGGYRAWTPAELAGIKIYLDSRKGIVLDGGGPAIGTWATQDAADTFTSMLTKPTLVADDFGTGVPSVRFAKAGYFTSTVIGRRTFPAGMSLFWVGKWTDTDAAVTQAWAVPGPVFGDNSGAVYNTTGVAAGALARYQYPVSPTNGDQRGGSLNDGVTRLCGWTHHPDTGGDASLMRAYVGATQQGTSEYRGYSSANNGVNVIGTAYSESDFLGADLGTTVAVDGIISATELARLHAWARLSFGAAA